MTQDKKDKIKDRIRKLFAMGNGKGASEQEMETAMRMANNLLTKFNLSIEDIEERTASGLGGDIAVVVFHSSQIPDWKFGLAWAVCKNFDVKFYYSKGYGDYNFKERGFSPAKITFYGYKISAESAVYAFESCVNQIEKLARKYKASKSEFEMQWTYASWGNFSRASKTEYREGIISGLEKAVWKAHQARKEEHGEKQITALVVSAEAAQQEALEKEGITLKSDTSSFSTKGSTGGNSFSNGQSDSHKISMAKGIEA